MTASDPPPPPPSPGWPYGPTEPGAEPAAPREPGAPASAPVFTSAAAVSQPASATPNGAVGHSNGRRALAGALITVLIAGAVSGGIIAFRFIRGSADSLVTLAPSDSAVYVNVNLDPSGGQKLAINSLLSKFPGLGGGQRDGTINKWLDDGLKDSGLTHADVRPWLGAQLSVVYVASKVSQARPRVFPSISDLQRAQAASAAPPDVAVLAASTDDGKAQAAFDKFRRGSAGSRLKWTTTSHGGVTEISGAAKDGGHGFSSSASGVWAITAHTVIIGAGTHIVNEVIDTVQGKHASLSTTADFKTVTSQLPGDRLTTVYVDLPKLITSASGAFGDVPGLAAQVKGLRGAGAATVVSSSGVEENVVSDFDKASMTADQRAQLAIGAHVSSILSYIPQSAYGFEALSGLKYLVDGVIAEFGGGAGGFIEQGLEQFGVTGPNGILKHLTGDAGFDVDKLPGASIPSGALFLATDSTTAAQTFLDTLAHAICDTASGCDAQHPVKEVYRGVSITSLRLSDRDISGVEPAWAVDSGLIILASTPQELRAALDARAGPGIRAAPGFRAVVSHVATSNTGMFYIDVAAIVKAVRAVLPADAARDFDAQVAPYVAPFKAVAGSSQNASDHTTETIFILMG